MTETEARFILGLGSSFSSDDLKRAYRKAAAENHPDRGGNPERMVLVNEAFESLSSLSFASQGHEPYAQSPHDPNEDASVELSSNSEATQPHPLDWWVIRVTGLLAIGGWGWALLRNNFKDSSDFWVFVFFGAPILYAFFFLFVRSAFSIGIRVYNLGLRMYQWAEGEAAQGLTPAPPAFHGSLIGVLLLAGLSAFYIGDGRVYYSGGVVFVGWVFIVTAVAVRKTQIGRTFVDALFHRCRRSAGQHGRREYTD